MKVYNNKNLIPLELWHGLTPWGPLHKAEKNSSKALAFFLQELHRGQAETLCQSDSVKLHHCKGFHKVILTGGRAKEMYEGLSELTFPFELSLLEENHVTQNLRRERTAAKTFLDWGQTSMKITTQRSMQIILRDLALFPFIEDEVVPASESRERIETFFKDILKSHQFQEPICVALPVEFQDENLLPSTYQGLEGPLLEIFSNVPELQKSLFLNDAVLAALGVTPQYEKELVLTCGHGFGGALWVR
jgi:hypothetical protein